MQLEWEELLDGWGNTEYEAVSGFRRYRVYPVVRQNKLLWRANIHFHDGEDTVAAAQAICQAFEDTQNDLVPSQQHPGTS